MSSKESTPPDRTTQLAERRDDPGRVIFAPGHERPDDADMDAEDCWDRGCTLCELHASFCFCLRCHFQAQAERQEFGLGPFDLETEHQLQVQLRAEHEAARAEEAFLKLEQQAADELPDNSVVLVAPERAPDEPLLEWLMRPAEILEATPTNRQRVKAEREAEAQRMAEHEARVAADMAEIPTSVRETVMAFENGSGLVNIEGKDRDGLMRVLEHVGLAIRYNTREAQVNTTHEALTWEPLTTHKLHPKIWAAEKERRVQAKWSPLDDRLQDFIREMLPRRFFYLYEDKNGEQQAMRLVFGKDKWNESIGAISYMTEIDPLLEWLETLPAWDGVPRLNSWLLDILNPEPNAGNIRLTQWAGQFIFLGIVWRTFEPGTKLDEMPVLNGPGGIGKSTALRHVFPENGRDKLFTDGLKLAGPAKDRVEALQGRALVEISEMHGVTRADIDNLNSFLSQQDDGAIRLAYRRDPEPTPRRFCPVGTSHRSTFLPNDDNLRRWVPCYFRGGHFNNANDVRKYLDEHRPQLWAEAMVRYRQGVEARLPDALKPLQLEATKRARARDTIMEDAVDSWLKVSNGIRQGFTLAKLAVGVGLVHEDEAPKLNMRDQHRIGAILQSLGYTPGRERREDGSRPTVWRSDWKQS